MKKAWNPNPHFGFCRFREGHRADWATYVAHAATWTPDGRHIIYGNGSTLYLCNVDGTESRKLVTVAGVPFGLRVSPDGNLLRFSVEDPAQHTSSLWEVAVDGHGLHPLLLDWNKPPKESAPTWTLDGKYFFFQSGRANGQDIWAIRERKSIVSRASTVPTAGHCRAAGF